MPSSCTEAFRAGTWTNFCWERKLGPFCYPDKNEIYENSNSFAEKINSFSMFLTWQFAMEQPNNTSVNHQLKSAAGFECTSTELHEKCVVKAEEISQNCDFLTPKVLLKNLRTDTGKKLWFTLRGHKTTKIQIFNLARTSRTSFPLCPRLPIYRIKTLLNSEGKLLSS